MGEFTRDKAYNPHKSCVPWDLQSLLQTPPKTYPAIGFEAEGVSAIYYEGLAYQGRPTRIFAYYAFPKEGKSDTVPGVVLVHGGGGTAFAEWVREWSTRGYAAIAIDLEGHTPGAKDGSGQYPGHAWSGPARHNVFADYRLAQHEQWMYHAGAAVMLANSLLRSFTEVDQQRVGMTGISWGGIIASLISGVDDRFAFAIPVYGCGYLFEADNQYSAAFSDMKEDEERTRNLWDPSAYLQQARMPMLWVNGTNDGHFPLTIFGKSYETVKRNNPATTLSIIPGMRHGHPSGWAPKVIYAFADSIVKQGQPLLRVAGQERHGRLAAARLGYGGAPSAARLLYSEEVTDWPSAAWLTAEARIVEAARTVEAEIPETAKAYFFDIEDHRGLTVSTSISLMP